MRALVLAIAFAACTPGIYRAPVRQPNFYSINEDGSRSQKYSRVNQWTSYGVNVLGAQARISAAYEDAQHAAAPRVSIDVFNASFPRGVTFSHGLVTIAKDAPYEAVGRFELGYWMDSAPRETEIEEDLRRLAAVSEGNTFVVEIQRAGHGNDRVHYVSGIVLRKLQATSPPVADATPRRRVHAKLLYKASAPGCLSEEQFADEVSARLGYSPWRPNATQTLRAEIRRDEREFVATITVAGAQPKQLRGATCKALTDAVVTAVIVRLDDPI